MFVASLYNLKGGVGKTSSCVNFAYMAAKDGYNTLIWDLDPQGAASYYYNVEPKVKSTAKKLIDHKIDLSEAIMATNYHSLDIIPAGISHRKMEEFLEEKKRTKKKKESFT